MTTIATPTEVSGLDDLDFEVELKDRANAPITAGTVRVKLCTVSTVTALDPAGVAPLTHVASGVWVGGLDAASVSTALAGLAHGAPFDVVLEVVGDYQQRRARCKKVAVVDATS